MMSQVRATIAGLGPVMQLAFVPRDFETALRFWIEVMGVGPFMYTTNIQIPDMTYKGVPTNIRFSQALAYWGDVQIELIELHDEEPSMFKDWRDAGHEGLQHVAILVDDLAQARAVCEAAGAVVIQEASFSEGGVFYVDTGGGPGTVVEILQLPPGGDAGFLHLKALARSWDGSEPVLRQDYGTLGL